jgi:putative mycofactocin binding protein MftB
MSVAFDEQRAWSLDERVALRAESFGALAYHFGTRRLSFLKHPTLVAVVEALAEHPTAAQAVAAAGVPDPQRPAIARALSTLAETGMIVERVAA